MSNWTTYRLGDICTLIAGFAFKSKDFGNYPDKVIKIADIQPPIVDMSSLTGIDISQYNSHKLEKYRIQIGDYVLAMTGATIGKLGRITSEQNAYINQRVLLFKPKGRYVDKNYLYYYLCQDVFYSYIRNHIDSETAQPNISANSIGEFTLTLPSLDEQRRIAGILGSLDEKIELNRRINANLEAQAQALFRSWFVDFEPFRDGPFVDSELGKIPQGWKVGAIDEIIQILSGFAFKSDTFTEAGPYRLITIKNVQDGSLNIDGAAYLSEIPDKMPQHCNLAIGDILLSLTGNVGRVCIVDRDSLLLNQRVAKLQPKDRRNTFFTYTLFRQDSFKQYLIQIAKGTAQLNLSPVETRDTKIVLPNHDILFQFGEIGQPLFDNIVSNCREIVTLSALRDTLLPKLMAGEIDLENI